MPNTNEITKIWDEFIEQEYQNYIMFIKTSKMPQYKTNYINGNEIEIPFIMQTDTSLNPMILNVNAKYMIDNKYLNCQPSLFHEFTHMLDLTNLFIEKDPLSRNKFLSLYTEYHASQIEFLRFIGGRSIDNIRNITPMDEFCVFGKKISAIDYYLNVCKLLFEKSCIYKSYKTPENYKYLMDAYMYVFGIKNIYDKYVNNIEIPKINDIFYEYMLAIYSLFQEYSINDLVEPLLQHIDTLDIIFARDFIKSQQ